MAIHSAQTDTEGLHKPKGFDAAANDTVLTKDAVGAIEYVAKAALGATGPTGPQGTTLLSVSVVDIDNPDLSAQTGVVGDTIVVYQVIASGVNKSRMYQFDTEVLTADAPRIVTGDSGTWVLSQDDKLTSDLIRTLSTGNIDGGELSVNADPTKFDIAAGVGVVVDAHTDPVNPIVSTLTWDAFAAEVPIHIASASASFVGLNNLGAIVQQVGPFSSSDRRDLIVSGLLAHNDNVNIQQVIDQSFPVLNPVNQFIDLFQAIGVVNTSGNVFSANGANLNMNKSAGVIVGPSANTADLKDPHTKTTGSLTALTFSRSVLTAGVFQVTPVLTAVDPENYNDPTLGLVTMANNQWQIIRIFYIGQSQSVILQQGQATYSSLSDAEASLNTEIFNKDPILTNVPLRGYLLIKKGTTDLTNAANVKFINGSKIDLGVSGGGASTSTTTLQGAYDNSSEPEFETTVAGGPVSYKQGVGASNALLEFFDSSAVSKGFLSVKEWRASTQVYSLMHLLADTATIATDCSKGNVHEVTLTANRTLGAPTNLKDGATYIWIITQDVGGTNTLAYNAVFKFSGGTAPVLSTAGSSVDILTGVSDGTNIYCSLSKGFS